MVVNGPTGCRPVSTLTRPVFVDKIVVHTLHIGRCGDAGGTVTSCGRLVRTVRSGDTEAPIPEGVCRGVSMSGRQIWSQGELSDLFRERKDEAVSDVERRPAAEIRFDPDGVIEDIASRYEVSSIELDFAEMTRSPLAAGSYPVMSQGQLQILNGRVDRCCSGVSA